MLLRPGRVTAAGAMSESEPAEAGRVNGVGRHLSMGGEPPPDERPPQKPLRKTKSVSFHSATCLRSERKVSSGE